MYKEHFGLQESPFRITPHTGRFFTGARRGALLEALCFAIEHEEGVICVSGEVGTGKTMLCRMLIERLPAHVITLYLANPSLEPAELLATFCRELGISLTPDLVPLRAIEERLIALHGEGQRVVAIIDEAHAMPRQSLEQVRLLSNLETSTHKLLQIALFGQPELNTLLAEPAMRSLRDRITQHFALEPLSLSDIHAYLDFRLRAAGYKGPALFGEAPLALLARASHGLTRRINILADKTLLAAFAANTHTITLEHVRAALAETHFAASTTGPRMRLRIGLALATVLLLGAALIWQARAPQPVPQPASSAPVAAASPAQLAPAAATSAPVSAAAPEALPLGPLARALIERSRAQMLATADDQWFIQLRTSPVAEAAALENFIASASKALKPELLQIYQARDTPGQPIGVIYGPFASLQAAKEALNRLPLWTHGHGALIRRYKSLRESRKD